MSDQKCDKNISRKARDFEKREQEILSIALRQFGDDDRESVTVAQIAREAGIAKGTMYLHFSSKHEIYARLALDFYRSLLQTLTEPVEGNAVEQLRQIIVSAFDFHLKRPAYRRVTQFCERDDFRHAVNTRITSELDKIEQQIEQTVCAVLTRGIEQKLFEACQPDQLILCLQCTFQGALTRYWRNRHNEQSAPDEFVEMVTHYMLDTITRKPEPLARPKQPAKQAPQFITTKNHRANTGNRLETTP